jgi:hypothetical protein
VELQLSLTFSALLQDVRIALADTEIDTLHGIGSLGFHLYILLRTFADYGPGIVGRTRPVSLAMLATYAECHTTRGAGIQVEQPTEKAIRNALAKLQRAGRQKGIEPRAGESWASYRARVFDRPLATA